jgi:hypothetical protein
MTERPRFFDDLAGLAGGALSAASGLRDEISALVRARVDEAIRRLDLVRREELDAVMELAVRARAESEALASRVAHLEDMVIPAAPRPVGPDAGADGVAEAPASGPLAVPDQDGNAPI